MKQTKREIAATQQRMVDIQEVSGIMLDALHSRNFSYIEMLGIVDIVKEALFREIEYKTQALAAAQETKLAEKKKPDYIG